MESVNPGDSSVSTATLKIKIFADGADKRGILDLYKNPLIQGFTTNPTLMRQVGITDYEAFAREILAEVPDRPFSLEVFSDDFDEMGRSGTQTDRPGPECVRQNTSHQHAGGRAPRLWSGNSLGKTSN